MIIISLKHLFSNTHVYLHGTGSNKKLCFSSPLLNVSVDLILKYTILF